MSPKIRDIASSLRERYLHLDDAVATRPRHPSAGLRSISEVVAADTLALIVEPKRSMYGTDIGSGAVNVGTLAQECERGGAAAISIVTEPELSGGTLHDLVEARSACELPILARDIIVDVRQVDELHVHGADAIFLPLSVYVDHGDAVPGQQLEDIVTRAHELGMEVVLSLREREDLDVALGVQTDVYNIDNRDENGQIDIERTLELLAAVPAGQPVISESVASLSEIERLRRAGVDALLIDEGHANRGLTHALEVFSAFTNV